MWAAPALVWLLLAAAAAWWPTGYNYVVAEDRAFEWVQVGSFAVAAAACLALARSMRRRNAAGAIAAVVGCAFFTVVVGEELAWGQRLFHVTVPALERVNDQGDVSLHNVGAGLTLSQVGMLAVALAGLLSRPAIGWLDRRRGRSTPSELLTPLFVAPWFALAAAFTAARLLVLPTPSHRVAKFSEVAELTLALAMAVTTVKLALAAARRQGAAPPAPTPGSRLPTSRRAVGRAGRMPR